MSAVSFLFLFFVPIRIFIFIIEVIIGIFFIFILKFLILTHVFHLFLQFGNIFGAIDVYKRQGLTGGVYKARERIHRAVADARLLANPASWSRVADSSPN